MCSYCNYEIASTKVYYGFWSVQLILLLMTLFWLSVALIELLGLRMSSFVVYEDLVVCA
jgi:hypothetical protein